MSFLTRNLRQDVVYWGTPTPDGMGGNTFATYVQIVGRWEDTNRKFINATGRGSCVEGGCLFGTGCGTWEGGCS